MRFAYADPPYPGKAHLYPENSEIDHAELVSSLQWYDAWALSTSADALPYVLSLVDQRRVRVGAWVKSPRRVRSIRALNAWEPVVFAGGRPLPGDAVPDVEDAVVARGRFRGLPDAMIGMKPPAFAEWLFRMLGARPGDVFVDLFPGSGAMSIAWGRYASLRDRQTTVAVVS